MAALTVVGALLLAIFVSAERAGSSPVRPQAVGTAPSILDPVPWSSPSGEHLITFRRTAPGGGEVLGVRSRKAGRGFGPFEPLSRTPGAANPDLVFGSDGRALAIWPVGEGPGVEQSIRSGGSAFGPAIAATPCSGLPSVAGTPSGSVVAACQVEDQGLAPFSGWAGSSTLPAPVAPDLQVTGASTEPLRSTATARGGDGTTVAVFEQVGAVPGTVEIVARVSGPGGSYDETESVASFPDPGASGLGGAAVLPNGTIAIAATTGSGGALFVRPAGAGASFETEDLPEDVATMPRADSFGRIHFLVIEDPDEPGTSISARVREPDGSIRDAIPIPTPGDSPQPVLEGFQVRPDGKEYLISRSDSGFFLTYRRPGGGAFAYPTRLAAPAGSRQGGAAALTRGGDLLLTWTERNPAGGRRLMLGGWDHGVRPELTRISVPRRTATGRATRLSARASDSMGILKVVWGFSDGTSVRGEKVRVRFREPGRLTVRITAIDRAGNRTIRFRKLTVVRSASG